MNIFAVQGTVMLVVTIALLAVKIYALVDALRWSEESYNAAGKLTKTTWVAILGVGVLCELVLPIMLLNLALTVAALVYLADVKPALSSLTRR